MSSRSSRIRLALAVALALAASPLAAAEGAAHYREIPPDFGGHPELNLSDNQAPAPGKEAKALAPKFDPALRATSNCGEEALGQLPWIGEDDLEGARQHERARIGGTQGLVARQGARLVVTPMRGPPLAFTDWNTPATRNADGDTRYYWFAGTMPGSGYLRVEVHYGHDAPGSYLITPVTGALAYLHNGDKVGAVSGDGARAAAFDELNEPFRLVLAALDAAGPRVEVECRFERPSRELRAHTCGWLDATRFELSWERDGEAPVPYQFVFDDKRWQLTVGAKASPVQVHCWAHKKP
jgi:hypothetical protein